MAQPTTCGQSACCAWAATTAEATLALNGRCIYDVQHTGLDTSLAASTGAVVLAFGAAVDADGSAEPNKYVLASGQSVPIGPGVTELRCKTASGTVLLSVSASSHVN